MCAALTALELALADAGVAIERDSGAARARDAYAESVATAL